MRSPQETLEAVRPLLAPAGITRVAVVTGLDRLSVPVVVVSRPAGWSLSVSMGKGVTTSAAKASGVMEALELSAADTVEMPMLRDTVEALDARNLPHTGISRFPVLAAATPLSRSNAVDWVWGQSLSTGKATLVPFDLVHTDGRVGVGKDSEYFPCSSNGLASGNVLEEAISHGLCELIERDALTLWQLSSHRFQTGRLLDLSSIHDPMASWLLDRFADAGLITAVFDITSDVGIACLHCVIFEPRNALRAAVYTSAGQGCHPDRSVALIRALTEAAQSRLALICGARDDVFRDEYDETEELIADYESLLYQATQTPVRRFGDIPSFESDDVATDVEHELTRLSSVDLDEAIVLRLSPEDAPISVVRVLVPGLEPPRVAHTRPGVRALATIRANSGASP